MPSGDGSRLLSLTTQRMTLELRPYQSEAIAAVEEAQRRGIRRPLLGLPTGTGKTVIFGALIAKRGGRALVLAHRDELLTQATQKIRQIAPGTQLGLVKAEANEITARVVVASIQTLARETRLVQLPRDFDTVVVDEAHHATADSYRRVLDWVQTSPLVLGVTATPERADKASLGDVWDEVVYSRSLLEMIRAGYVADLRGLRVRLDVDFSRLRVSHGDFVDSEAAEVLTAADAPAHACAAYLEHAAGRKALLFTPTVELAHLMADSFQEAGISAEAIDGSLPLDERRAILGRLRRGETQVVANCAVLTEGFDEPSIDCVIIARPTRSRILYVQMIGRGTRTFFNKSDCLVIDLVGATERFDLMTMPKLFQLGDPQKLEGRTITEALEHEAAIATPDAPIVVEEVNLFRDRSKLAWVAVDERWTVPTGRGLLVLEPYGDSWRVVVSERGAHNILGAGLDLGYAHGVAEDFIRRVGAEQLVNPEARWRKNRMSDKQRDLLDGLRVAYEPNLSRGEASDLISAALAKRELLHR
jgi:ATP-dependent helicase IRC3